MESVTTRGTESSETAKKVTYMSLGQIHNQGSNLNTTRFNSGLRHLPVPDNRLKSNGVACALCCWATGYKHTSQLLRCNDCGFHLCVWCYKLFHTVPVFYSDFQDTLCSEVLARQPKQPAKAEGIRKTNTKKKKAAKSRRTD